MIHKKEMESIYPLLHVKKKNNKTTFYYLLAIYLNNYRGGKDISHKSISLASQFYNKSALSQVARQAGAYPGFHGMK